MAAALLGGGEAHAQTDVEHWSASLTPAQEVLALSNFQGDSEWGYSAAATVDGNPVAEVGTLTPSTFTYGSVSYTVKRLYASTDSENFVFETSPALPDDANFYLRLPNFRSAAGGSCDPLVATYDYDLDSDSASADFDGVFVWDATQSTRPCTHPSDWSERPPPTRTVSLRGPAASGTVWSTTMLVASTSGGHFYGYETDPSYGSLADDDFEYGSPAVTYTVTFLIVGTTSVTFNVDSAGLPQSDTLTLELGAHEFAFSDSANSATTWTWHVPSELDDPATEFPGGATATVCLRTDTQTCPAGRIDLPAVSTDATLSALSVTGGGSELVTNFASGTTVYTASVANGVEEATFAPTTNHTGATVRYVKGIEELTDADDMEDGFQVPLAVGANRTDMFVTAEDGTTTLSYIVIVTRAAAGMTPTCTLNAGDLWCGVLTIGTAPGGPGATSYGYVPLSDKGSLSPNSFTHEGTPITVIKVVHNVYSINPTDLEIHTSPALPSGYNFVLQAGSQSFSFAGGQTVYTFDPSGLDWSMSDGETVTLRLRETPSEHATLSGLTVNDGGSDLALTPAFASDTTSYTVSVPNTVEEVTVTPTRLNSNATIAWLDGSGMTLPDADTAAGQQVSLAEGENVIRMEVTSQDGTAMETYMVTVTRAVAPPDAPTGFSWTPGNARVALGWDDPAADADITHHEYRYKTDSDYPDAWKKIPYSAPGGFNEDGFTVTGLDNGTAHTFQLRAVNSGGESGAVESSAVTPSGDGYIVESITMRRYDNQDGEPYGIGDRIVFVVQFSGDTLCVTAASPKVKFNIGSSQKNASKSGGGTGDKLWYEYNVAVGDFDSDGIEIPAGATALPDTYYAAMSCNNSYDKSGIKAQGPFPDRKVDGVYPSVDSAVVNGTALVLTWDETLRDDSVPAASDFAVTVAGSGRSVSNVALADSAVRLTLASAVTAGQTVTMSYTKGTNPLKDLGSNDAPGLTDQAVTNSTAPPDAPTNFAAAVGNAQVTLSWDPPAFDSGVTKHQFQYKTGDGAYGGWEDIETSGVGGETSYTKTGLTNELAHTFQLRAVNAAGESDEAEAGPLTPTPGICGRTQKVQEIIIYYLGERNVERTCAAVNVADLASFTDILDMANESISSLKSGDFAGLTNVTMLRLGTNTFTTLPRTCSPACRRWKSLFWLPGT